MKTQDKIILNNIIEKDIILLNALKSDLENDFRNIEKSGKLAQIKRTLIAECLEVLNLVIKKDFKKLSFYNLKITKHGGKMAGIPSLSTFKKLCNTCLNNEKIKNSVCVECYANDTLKQYDQLKYALIYNTLLLKYTIIKEYQSPRFNNQYVRIESFSDLQNEIHLQNIITIIKCNKSCRFGLWTKNLKLIKDYLQNNKLPINCNLILSSLFLNSNLLEKFRNNLINTGNVKENQCKIFTVYEKNFIINNDIKINCGSIKCLNCLQCYKKNNIVYINEILK